MVKIPDETLNFIAAQEAHSAIAFSVGLVGLLLFRSWVPELALLAIALIKESLFDPKAEDNQPFLWEGARDFSFYVLGALLLLPFWAYSSFVSASGETVWGLVGI
jgi:hypothetical protein